MESQKGKIKVNLSREKCVGAGICISVAPRSFDIGEDQLTILLDPIEDGLHALLKAEDDCPMGAIRVVLVDEFEE